MLKVSRHWLWNESMATVEIPEHITNILTSSVSTENRPKTKKTKEKKPARGQSFEKVLKETEAEELWVEAPSFNGEGEEILQQLLDEVHEKGEELKEKPFTEQIRQYKAAVRNFLQYVIEKGFIIKEQTSGSNILKRKKYTLVQVIDKKLEQLAAGILSGQCTQLDILSRVDEIKGLLINLLQ